MSNEYKVFDDGGLTALTDHMKATRTKANSNEAAVTTLGEDLAELSSDVVAALGNKQDKLTGTEGQMVGFDAAGNAVAQDMPSSSSAYVLKTDDAGDPALTSGSYAEAYAAFTNDIPVSLRWRDIDFQLVDYNSVNHTLQFSNTPLYDSDEDIIFISMFTLASNGTLTITKDAELQVKLTGNEGEVVGFDADGNAVAQDMPSSAYVLKTNDAESPTLTSGSYAKAYSAFTNGVPVSLRWNDIDFQLVDYNSVDNTLRFSNPPLYDSGNDTIAIAAFVLASDGTLTITKNAILAEKEHTHPVPSGVTTSGTGSAYTATVEGIDALKVGVSFTMIPNVVSTSLSPTLNVNSLGAKTIRRPLSASTATTVPSTSKNWLAAGKPIRMTYDGTYWVADLVRPYATDLYGRVSVNNGGVPSCSTDDNDKFLRVVSGTPTWVTISNAEEASF